MKIGEIVETLIIVRKDYDLTPTEDEAVCEACNILDKFPRMAEPQDAKDAILTAADTKDRLDTMMGRWNGWIEAIRSKIDNGTLTEDDRRLLDEIGLPHDFDRRKNRKE